MSIFDALLSDLPDGDILEVRIGLNWTMVVVEVDGGLQCGLASTLKENHKHTGDPTIPDAGRLTGLSALALAGLVKSDVPTRVSLGMASVNALLPRQPASWIDQNVEDLLVSLGQNHRVALVGHFPFVPRLRNKIKNFDVIDRYPVTGDYPEGAAPEILPHVGVAAITGMTLLNGTFEGLKALCAPDAILMVIGPSTPLSPKMFDFGIDILAGSIVTDVEAVMRVISEGANFRQVKKAGVRLVTVSRPSLNLLKS
jgi:uncharacterized protein (DUF4213/DUF364 family)